MIKKLFVIILVLFFFSCDEKNNSRLNKADDTTDAFERIKSKTISSKKRLKAGLLDSFIKECSLNKSSIVFVYNTYDCNSCIFEGLSLLEGVFAESDSVGVASSYHFNTHRGEEDDKFLKLFDPSRFANLNRAEQVPSELLSLPTPFVMLLDANLKVKDAFFPLTGINQSVDSLAFVESIFNN